MLVEVTIAVGVVEVVVEIPPPSTTITAILTGNAVRRPQLEPTVVDLLPEIKIMIAVDNGPVELHHHLPNLTPAVETKAEVSVELK